MKSSGVMKALKENWFVYVLLLVVALGLKQHYSISSVDNLLWILSPTSKLVSLFTGISFNWEAGEGYINRKILVSIAKPCAGLNYMTILFILFTAPFISSIQKRTQQLGLIAAAFLLSFLVTIPVNSFRIITAVALYDAPIYTGGITKELVHTIDGILIFFGSLWFIFPLYQRLISSLLKLPRDFKHISCAPILAYIAITIIIPICNAIIHQKPLISLSHLGLITACTTLLSLFALLLYSVVKKTTVR